MLFKKLSTVERVYNIGLEQNSLFSIFNHITLFVKEAEEDLIKLYDLRVLEKIPVKNIMTRNIITINKNDSIDKLKEYIEKYRHMGYPVVDDDGKLVGVVTFRDLEKGGKKTTIEDIMTPKDKLVFISPETSASESQKIMAKMDIGRLLVLDDKGELIGIVSRGDIVRTYKIYSKGSAKIQKCSRISNFYFYDRNKKEKLKNLVDDLIMLLGGRDYIISEKEDYIEALTKDWEPLVKIMMSGNTIDHISITTKSINILEMDIIREILKKIDEYAFEEIVLTDHITLIDEKSSIQRVITDVTLFNDSKKTFGTITIRSDF
ncbi:CBS domain-containing protein [Methanofervidicoccus sp. A16]|uniref:CBS domain-containing protein n=1 Tax=Methanofervidicoccus sp. A16 TaxID=2607662 RepID=UPI00118C528C|nr:CBS domain-containing protein [Methanofervidicoccus sp. A16]AXI25024.1 CBS domain-containing protein [Methanofervidicoccus sp. A16]